MVQVTTGARELRARVSLVIPTVRKVNMANHLMEKAKSKANFPNQSLKASLANPSPRAKENRNPNPKANQPKV